MRADGLGDRFPRRTGDEVREFFDGDWLPAAGIAGRIAEPGHCYEWAFLLDRWAKLQFNLEHPWDQFVSDFLAERDLESTEFDSALGTMGGGNHFAELQMVEKVLEADEFKKLGLGKQQLVMLVHSGSRGLGESILRAHVDQHFGNGVEADSFAAGEYLRGHDFAVRWAKASRELIAKRFVAALGAEAECLWDGCHNSIIRHEVGWC